MTDVSNRVDINRVLMQMREMRDQVQSSDVRTMGAGMINPANTLEGALRSDTVNQAANPDKLSFSDLLKQAVDSVNETQARSGELQTAYEMGDTSVDITQVMIQMQKASVSFEAMTQVRNRLVSAYQDIMNMPL